jgi:hypothetical protein
METYMHSSLCPVLLVIAKNALGCEGIIDFPFLFEISNELIQATLKLETLPSCFANAIELEAHGSRAA